MHALSRICMHKVTQYLHTKGTYSTFTSHCMNTTLFSLATSCDPRKNSMSAFACVHVPMISTGHHTNTLFYSVGFNGVDIMKFRRLHLVC